MRVVRWILLVPVALAAGMLGSLVGGIAGSLFGQAAADTGSALVGPFGFVVGACAIAPAAQRRTVGGTAALLVGVLAFGTFVLSFTSIEEFSHLSQREQILTPVVQFIGALYALFVSLPYLTPGTTVEDFGREVVALGTIIVMLGLAITLIGGISGAFGRGWFAFVVGLAVVALGKITWLFPFVRTAVRANKARAAAARQIRDTSR